MSVETKYLDPVKYAQEIDDIAKKYFEIREAETTDMVAILPKVIGGTALDKGVHRRNTALRKKLTKKKVIEESVKAISADEIINALGGEAFYKKSFKTFQAARTYTINNLRKVMDVLNIKQKDIPLSSIENKLKSLVGSK